MKITKIIYLSIISGVLFTGCTQSEKSNDSEKTQKEVEFQEEKVPTISVSEKKERFKEILVPITIEIYNELEEQYQAIKLDIENNTNIQNIEELKEEYNADSNEKLLYALKPHPISIVLAQAAAESAWLTSRFAKEANNIFGVWSFSENEPRIAATGLRGDKTIYLKKYDSVKEAVRDYYKNLGKTWAYSEFRKQRTLTADPYVLSDHLSSYSEKKEVYTELLKSMIKYNEFEQYDINTIDINETTSIMNTDTDANKDINIENEIETNSNIDVDANVDINIDEEKDIETETATNLDTDTNISIEEQ
ncbi:MAG: glucosaminidase domain-containing protein [Arcobacteraceae bacterium]